MALKLQSLFLILAFSVATTVFGVSAASGGRKTLAVGAKSPAPGPVPGAGRGFVALSPKDPNVIYLAKFAINEYNKKQKATLKFVKVFQAAYAKTEQGLTYGIVIEAKDGTGLHHYDADVLVNQNSKTLVAFKKNEPFITRVY